VPSAPVVSSTPVVAELRCQKCGRLLIREGKLKCSRCGKEVPATLGQEEIFCPFCQKPRIFLAKRGRALCPRRKGPRCGDEEGTPMNKEETMTTDKVTEVLNAIKNFSPEERNELMEGMNSLSGQKAERKETRRQTIERVLTKALSLTKEGKLTWDFNPREGYGFFTSFYDTIMDGIKISVIEDWDVAFGIARSVELDGVIWSTGSCLYKLFHPEARRISKILKEILKLRERDKKEKTKQDRARKEAEVIQKLASK